MEWFDGGCHDLDDTRKAARRLHGFYEDRLAGHDRIKGRERHRAMRDLQPDIAHEIYRHKTRRAGNRHGWSQGDCRHSI